MIRRLLHRIEHRLKSNPCKLLDIIHEPSCSGTVGLDCRCDWIYVLECVKCGRVSTFR
jgi:hypothetical protein